MTFTSKAMALAGTAAAAVVAAVADDPQLWHEIASQIPIAVLISVVLLYQSSEARKERQSSHDEMTAALSRVADSLHEMARAHRRASRDMMAVALASAKVGETQNEDLIEAIKSVIKQEDL